MKTNTLKHFKSKSHIDSKLIGAVVRQAGGWEYYRESSRDVSNYGASGGYAGFIYYSDTEAFTRRNKQLILELATERATLLDAVGLIAFIASFNCLRDDFTQEEIARAIYQGKGDAVTQVFNALAWFALEEVSISLSESQDEEIYSN